MIFIFGIDRYKVKLHEKQKKLEIMNSVVMSGNKIPVWYVEERDSLVAEVARLEKILELKEKKRRVIQIETL